MRRLLRRMVVLGSVVGLVMALDVGVALAHEGSGSGALSHQLEVTSWGPTNQAIRR